MTPALIEERHQFNKGNKANKNDCNNATTTILMVGGLADSFLPILFYFSRRAFFWSCFLQSEEPENPPKNTWFFDNIILPLLQSMPILLVADYQIRDHHAMLNHFQHGVMIAIFLCLFAKILQNAIMMVRVSQQHLDDNIITCSAHP
jgi:hypothetical protein